LHDSLDILEPLYRNCADLVSNEALLLANVWQLNYVIGEIVNAKRLEAYKARAILRDEQLTNIVDRIVSNLEYIRNVLMRIQLSRSYKYTSALRIQEKFQRVVTLESLNIARLTSMMGS
jgi:hypothetical protein